MFFASSGSGYGADSGFGGVYEEDAGGLRTRRGYGYGLDGTLTSSDVLRCSAFTGPALAVIGLFFLVFATFDPQHKLVRNYNAAVAAWAGPEGGCAQFGAALPPSTPLTMMVALPPPSASEWITLYSSTAPAARLGNATRRVVTPPASAALSFVGLVPLLPLGLPGNATAAVLALSPDTAGGAFSPEGVPLQVVSCTSTASMQYGVNCSADSPPAPAPSAATELFVLERRHRRRGRALAQAGSDGGPLSSGGFFSGGGDGSPPRPPVATTCRAYYRTVTLLTGVTLVATPPAPPDGLGVASNNWTLGLAPCGLQHTVFNVPVPEATFRADSRQSNPAWCNAWPAVAAGVEGGAQRVGLTVTLRAAGDPVLVGASLTRCRMALGVPPGDYARRGALCLLLGSLLTAGGLWGLARAAAAEGHALAVPSPMASLRAAVRAVTTYGATGQGAPPAEGEAVGMPATFLAAVGDPAGARRRAAAAVQPPPAAQPFDGGAEAHKL